MFYYKHTADTPYCGTEQETYHKFEKKPTEEELDELGNELVHNNAESYEYFVHGWDADPVGDGEMSQEEYDESIENYYADCSGYWTVITVEEYNENA